MEAKDTPEAADEVASSDDRSGSDSSRVEREGAGDSLSGAETETKTPKRAAPPVTLPATVNSRGPNESVRSLQVALRDLGFYGGKIDGYYTQAVRNAVSKLQVDLIKHGHYSGRPSGVYSKAVYEAAVADPAFNVG